MQGPCSQRLELIDLAEVDFFSVTLAETIAPSNLIARHEAVQRQPFRENES